MRDYGSKSVRDRIVRMRAEAVCPFPGKHPLRLTWRVASKTVGVLNVSYFGKLTTAAWKRFADLSNQAYGDDVFATTRFSLFDRNGELTSGSPFDLRPMNTIHKLRYFPHEHMPWRDVLLVVEPRACGPYWIYATHPPSTREAATIVRNIETVIPTLRNR